MMINHIMCASKILTDLFHKTKNKYKNGFVKVVYSVLVIKICWKKHKKDCLRINGKQSKLEGGIIEFQNYFKQIPVPFKIYADFEPHLRSVESYEGSYTKKYQDHLRCSFAYKVVYIDDRFTQPIVVYRGENAAYEFIKAILKGYKYCIKVMSKLFNKNLIMSQQSKKCWICKNLIDNDEEKVRDHCQITSKFRGAAHEILT